MFQDLLKELRAKKGVTQSQLANQIGVSPGNVGDWEGGKSKPGYVALSALARFFEVSADYLLELDEPLAKAGPDLSTYKVEQGLTCDNTPLSEEEADLVAMFRLLPSEHRREVFDYVYFKYKRAVEEGKESIYSTYFEDEYTHKSGPGKTDKVKHETA